MDSVLWLDLKGKERESEPHLPKKSCVDKPIEGLTNKHSASDHTDLFFSVVKVHPLGIGPK